MADSHVDTAATDLSPTPWSRRQRVAALGVHAFTASGVVLGGLALVATLEGHAVAAFLWLGLALLVDGIDGTLARRARVREVAPEVDGAILDNVVDYVTYVAVPAVMIYVLGLVPAGWATLTTAFVLAVACYTFANVAIKTSDHHFEGFPAIWNVVVFYLYVLEASVWINLLVIAACGILTFVPLKYVHPIRVARWRAATLLVTLVWATSSLLLLLGHEDGVPPASGQPLAFWAWVAASVYFALVSLYRSRPSRATRA